ncbi:MAG TPA: GNAT family N-acetyltransferase [Acidimicrobiales bacterium]|nr:GNAT family N-acetyltransferase [Acidimicrobiales bacterium]
MSETPLTRSARSHDWLALKTIRLEALRDTPDAYGSSLEAALRFPDDHWRAMTAQQPYFLVERAGQVVGMTAGGFNDAHAGEHWLFAMYVTPSARGGLVAMALVDEVVAWARADGASALYLDVTTTLVRARAFYQKAGFVPTGERRVMDRDRSIELLRLRRDLVGV